MDDGQEIHVLRVLFRDLPEAVSIDMVKEAASLDPEYQRLIRALQKGLRRAEEGLEGYKHVWGELSLMDGLVCRGEKIVLPDAELARDGGNIRDWVVELGHEGHQGVGGTKRLLRTRLWFPGMDEKVERKVRECLACQASTKVNRRDPLKPTTAPKEPWKELAMDHWGPT